MNTWLWLNPTAVLPTLAVQQLFHALIWLAVLSWLGVACLPSYDRRWRWLICSTAALLVLWVWSWVLPSLGLVFQTPSLLTLCACLAAAWSDVQGPSARLFRTSSNTRIGTWAWLSLTVAGWVLLIDAVGHLPWDVYSWGFDPRLPWFAWGLAGLWMVAAYLTGLPEWHAKAATCWLVATGLFVATHAPSGNAWDAWLDPGLWLYAHYQWVNNRWFQRTRINHS